MTAGAETSPPPPPSPPRHKQQQHGAQEEEGGRPAGEEGRGGEGAAAAAPGDAMMAANHDRQGPSDPDPDSGGDEDNERNVDEKKERGRHTVLALYKFQRIDPSRLESLKSELASLLQLHGALGNLLLAAEGINGTVCYPTITAKGEEDPVRRRLLHKFPGAMARASFASHNVFLRLRVRIKAEVVTMGVPTVNLVKAASEEEHDANDDGGGIGDDAGNGGDDKEAPNENGRFDAPGRYVKPREWNDLLRDKSTLVIDTRNEYEIRVGTFENAVNPGTSSFVEFPQWLKRTLRAEEETPSEELPQEENAEEDGWAASERCDQSKEEPHPQPAITRLAFFCTGGVRCEKATAYARRLLREQQQRQASSDAAAGATHMEPEVCHLEGGILNYLESVSADESMFHGECYVFDNRVAVAHGLRPTDRYQACRACRHPLSPDDVAAVAAAAAADNDNSNEGSFVEGRQCRYCADDPDRQARRARYEMRHRQVAAAHRRGRAHLGSNSADAVAAKQKAANKAKAKAAAATAVAAAGADDDGCGAAPRSLTDQ